MKDYVFEIGEAILRLAGEKVFVYGANRPAWKIPPQPRRLLEILLETKRSDVVLTYDDISQRLGANFVVDQSQVRGLRKQLVEFLATVCSDAGHDLGNKPVFDLTHEFQRSEGDKRTKYFGYRGALQDIWNPDASTPEEQEDARNRHALEKKGGSHVKEITDDLRAAFPDLAGMFGETEGAYPLPVHLPDMQDISAPKFPIPVVEDQDRLEKNRDADDEETLFKQRRAQGSHLYPGTIYSLKSAAQGDWRLGWTIYTDLIESCDYIGARLKEAWMQARIGGVGIKERRRRMAEQCADDPLGKISAQWSARAQQVLAGRFDAYLAGLAFSVPTFRIEENGALSLLFAEGSPAKQSGAGQKHVCPAGMLEFFQPLGAGVELTLDQFRAIVAKELLEETLFGSQFQLPAESAYSLQVSKFSTEKPGIMISPADELMHTIRSLLIPCWDDIWKQFPAWQELANKRQKPASPSLGPLRSVLAFDPETDPCFVAVDALCFRPELIIPIYQFDPLSAMVNWEYKNHGKLDDAFETYTWESLDQLEDWVVREAPNWCAPGLAAAYLGARHYFENENTCVARAREIVAQNQDE